MSIYNEEKTLSETLISILTQQEIDFEFIVVNDGSTDSSAKILDDFARSYSNLKVIHQLNAGLTRALIRGCKAAQGEFIARQDCGDIALPHRLRSQADILDEDSHISLVSAWVDFLSPDSEYLYTCSPSISRSSQTLRLENIKDFLMPAHHGCTMFRNSTYNLVGGYRANFYFAQDRDLWTRLIEKGDHVIIPQVLYKATININSISGKYASEQRNLKNLIDQVTLARRNSKSEEPYLKMANDIQPQPKSIDFQRQSNSCYFIGSCLLKNHNSHSLDYFTEAIKYNKLHYRSWLKIFLLKTKFIR
ncbi:glycosyltransferase [Aphanizomenon sp. UHCC 0183]|uniref:glycosyltransferase family 2 protein n=1 Tax=Aphanizomenon sp. UHCC 0183 TaxID=2590028 RepID=UPI001C2CB6BF|nr:glycosyltransferase [Aphanizomenon sp. UHCC 0183]